MKRTLLTSLLLIAALTACGDRDSDLFTVGDGDCDDENADVFPSNEEVCDGLDNDCDGEVDNEATDATAFYLDSDGDGFGDGGERVEACALPEGYVENTDDCDDGRDDVNPSAPEVCGGGDEDCDGAIDEAGADGELEWWEDSDEDGFGDASGDAVLACDDPSTVTRPYVDENTDCDDEDPEVNPGATEICDDRDTDEDCDGAADDLDDSTDTATMVDWFLDADMDGFGSAIEEAVRACDRPGDGDFVRNNADCDDSTDAVSPDALERCNAIDDDCDETTVEEGLVVFERDDGTLVDRTVEWGRGSRSSPASLSLDEAGSYNICFGEYFVDIDIEADVSLLGVNGSEETELNGAESNSIVTVNGDGLDVSIEGLTLTNGSGDNSGVLSSYPEEGGGLYCEGESSVTVTDSVISSNVGDLGGGLLVHTCDVSVIDSTVAFNESTFGGAALVWAGGSLTFEGSTIDANSCDNSGGGVYVQGDDASTSTLTIEDSLFVDNSSLYGAGIALLGSAEATCTGTSSSVDSGFHANVADGTYADSAVALINLDNSFEAELCDFGEPDSGDDNSTDDVSTDQESEAGDDPNVYAYGDDASFSCTEDGCE